MELEQIKDKALPILREAGVRRASFFGSYARGENRDESDVDILVELPEGSSLFDLVDLEERLRLALDRKADVVTYNSLHPLLREKILREQITIL